MLFLINKKGVYGFFKLKKKLTVKLKKKSTNLLSKKTKLKKSLIINVTRETDRCCRILSLINNLICLCQNSRFVVQKKNLLTVL